jgi:hypothetical protein
MRGAAPLVIALALVTPRAVDATPIGGHVALSAAWASPSPHLGFAAGAGLDMHLTQGFSAGLEISSVVHPSGEPDFAVPTVTVTEIPGGFRSFSGKFHMKTWFVRGQLESRGGAHGHIYAEIGGGLTRLRWDEELIATVPASGSFFGPDTFIIRPRADVHANSAMLGFGWRSARSGGPLRAEAGVRVQVAAKRLDGRKRTWFLIPVHLGVAF